MIEKCKYVIVRAINVALCSIAFNILSKVGDEVGQLENMF